MEWHFMTAFSYSAFGLTITSQIEIPEFASLAAAAGRPTHLLTIEIGNTPREIPGATRVAKEHDYQVGAGQILFDVPRVARFWAQGGRRLVVQPARNADPAEVRLFLKGSGLAAVLHQRGLFPLHASAVEFDGGCVAFLGDSGAGKSTLAAMMSRRGYRLISDDVVATRVGPRGVLLADTSAPVIKLWPDSLDIAGFSETQAPFEAAAFRKHQIEARDRFRVGALPVRQLYFLQWLPPSRATPQIEDMSPFDAMLAVRANVYRSSLIGAMRREAAFAEFCASLLETATSFSFTRSCDMSRAQNQIDLLEQHLTTSSRPRLACA